MLTVTAEAIWCRPVTEQKDRCRVACGSWLGDRSQWADGKHSCAVEIFFLQTPVEPIFYPSVSLCSPRHSFNLSFSSHVAGLLHPFLQSKLADLFTHECGFLSNHDPWDQPFTLSFCVQWHCSQIQVMQAPSWSQELSMWMENSKFWLLDLKRCMRRWMREAFYAFTCSKSLTLSLYSECHLVCCTKEELAKKKKQIWM